MKDKRNGKPQAQMAVRCSAVFGDCIDLVFDIKLRRPACVILQSFYGCGHNNRFLQMTFESRDWLTAPTPDMRKVRGTREEWKRIAAKSPNDQAEAPTEKP